MRSKQILMMALLAFGSVACNKQTHVRVPADAGNISYFSVSITISMQRKDVAMVEGGLISGIIYQPGLRIQPGSIWPDGTPASISIEVTPDALQSLVSALVAEFNDVVPVYTYSEWRADAPRNPDLGIYTSEYLAHLGGSPCVMIRFSGDKDDYNRSMWLVVPMEEFTTEFWNRLVRTMPPDERFQGFVTGLRTFWRNNA